VDLDDLDRSIGDLTAALGDPTRRGIYLAIRESASPVTAPEIAARFNIHPNVARHHLDRLKKDGFLEPVTTPRPKTSGAGRPARGYRSTNKQVDLKFPTRTPNLLAELLIKIINELDGSHPVAEIAAAVGEDFGRELAARFAPEDAESKNEAMMAVAKAMGSIGFGSEAVGTTILTSHCPFGDVASSNPAIICSLDQGIVRGLFGVMNSKADPVLTPDAAHANCVTTTVDIQLSGTRS
jgi:predicted ArsR family transcriptional regulator